jgi:PPK2 family polyphosphate:nucleotide phosphotransferase
MDGRLRFARELATRLRVASGSPVDLTHEHDASATPGAPGREEADTRLTEGLELLAELQDRLAAEGQRALLLVLQGLDAAGKDGIVKHVMSGVNTQGVDVHSFKQPSPEDLAHDWLWRCQIALPTRGRIGIFNRSHYEEVLVVRVHPQLLAREKGPDAGGGGERPWHVRYRAINDWERHLHEAGTEVVKVMLHVSKHEQAKRFLERIDNPDKNWKFSAADVAEHSYYDDYQRAYAEMLENTSTKLAPWHVVPADHKWYARLATAAVVIDALAEMDPRYPEPDPESRRRMLEARPQLEHELGH